MAKEKPEDFVVDVVHRFSDLITDIDHYGDCPHLPFDHNEYIALNCNLKPIDNIYENNENNENNTLQEEWHCNQIDDKHQIELQCVQTQHKHNKQHSNANKGTKRAKVGRKSLKTLGFSDEQIKLRIQSQNKCAQQRKRDRMRDIKMRLISDSNNNNDKNNDNTCSVKSNDELRSLKKGMEFAELIKTPKLDLVTLTAPLNESMEGTLCITSHHLIVSSRTDTTKELWLLHSMVDIVERKPNTSGGTLILKCKDYRIINLEIPGTDEYNNIANSIEWLSNLDDPRLLYPYFFRAMFDIVEDGWTAFCIENEFANILMYSEEWRISYVNQNFAVCPSYPEAVIVPKAIDDDCLIAISSFRCLGRFPVLSYFHRNTKTVLLRSGQPMVGTNSKRCKEDEKLINTVLGSGKRGYIIETRTQNLAQLARTRGGGFEPEVHYPLWRRVHKPIDRHSSLLDSLSKMIEACNDTNSSMDKWLSRLESCGWLTHIKDVLSSACLVAQCMDQEAASVLVHGAEGMDSTLQVCSLTQVILNPDCRTVHGFEALIEREWLQAGHPFATRCKHSAYTIPSARTREQSPIFLVFLDCVYQIYNQFPCSFEFNEKFLLLLFEHSYASQFGTFLGNCIKDRKEMNFAQKTISLWSYVNRPEILSQYLNPIYEPNNNVIWPSVAPQSLELWKGIYLRWIIDQKPYDDAWKAIFDIKIYEKELKVKASRLRRRLAELTQNYA